jgi:hypothetical protein
MHTTKQILIITNGFVFMGDVKDVEGGVYVTDLQNIRRYGTERGIGQIAMSGPTKDTILDPFGEGFFPTHTIIGRINCKV